MMGCTLALTQNRPILPQVAFVRVFYTSKATNTGPTSLFLFYDRGWTGPWSFRNPVQVIRATVSSRTPQPGHVQKPELHTTTPPLFGSHILPPTSTMSPEPRRETIDAPLVSRFQQWCILCTSITHGSLQNPLKKAASLTTADCSMSTDIN